MKRTSLVAAVMGMALLLAGIASASTSKERYGASLQGGVNNAGLEVTVHFKNGKPTYVDQLVWHNVNCGGPYADKQTWKASVNDSGKFHKTHDIQNAGGTVTFTGAFKHHNKKIVGTLSITPAAGCDTGKMDYVAS
jgi:hypothetical protein